MISWGTSGSWRQIYLLLRTKLKSFCSKILIMGGIPSTVGDTTLDGKVCQVLRETGIEVSERDIPSCQWLKKNKSQTFLKFSSRKDFLKILRKKKSFLILILLCWTFQKIQKYLLSESLCPCYRDIWNKCKLLKDKYLIHEYYTISSTVSVNVEENGSTKSITPMVDLQRLFR